MCFFFKQKTAYEMRISDGSSDVCSSDLHHRESAGSDEVRAIIEPVVREAIPAGWIDDQTRILINPTGRFVIGGPESDTGLTGRKIIVDTYGGTAPPGGGAFSGKAPTKVDGSAAYAARSLAQNVVPAGHATQCHIQIATPSAPGRSARTERGCLEC